MKKPFLMAGLLAIVMSVTVHAPDWSPDMATINKLEAAVHPDLYSKSGGKAYELSDYARYYAGYTEGGHRMIAGEFVAQRWADQKPAGVYIVANREKFPVICQKLDKPIRNSPLFLV